MVISSTKSAYLAGFLDGDGSIYVRLKPSKEYRYGYQIAPYVVFFQSAKYQKDFQNICNLMKIGYLRERNDGIVEYIIGREENIKELLKNIKPFLILKKKQASLMLKILKKKSKIKDRSDFEKLVSLVEEFRFLNYSKKRKPYINPVETKR
ncbi:MAG: LAGLIDADG family homing endonuclease [Patescibacteria group bacterium]